MNIRPEPSEYADFYGKYIAMVTTGDIVAALDAQRLQMIQEFAARSERDGNFRYAPDKWTVKEVLGHVSDAERIFAYRALRIARGNQAAWARRGVANKNEVTVRALAFIIAGHELHHRRILDERYFAAIPRA